MKGIKEFFSNLKFVRKIQIGFLLLGLISGIIAFNDILQMNSFKNNNRKIFTDFVYPQQEITRIYSQIQNIQFTLLKLSNKGFNDSFQSEYNKYVAARKDVDESLKKLAPVLKSLGFEEDYKQIDKLWNDYKSLVADGIVSAVSSKNYDYASVITTSVGEDVGNKLNEKFSKITSEMRAKSKIISQNIISNADNAIVRIVIGMIIGTIILLIAIFVISPAISEPVAKMLDLLKDFARGHFDVHLEIDTKDEFGQLADALRKLREMLKDKIVAAQEIARGRFVHVKPVSEMDELAIAFNKEIDVFEQLVNEVKKIVAANKEGNLEIRGDVEKFEGDWKDLIEGINEVINTIVQPINKTRTVLQKLANGNINVRMEGDFKGAYKEMQDDINAVVDSLRNVVVKLHKTTEELSVSVAEISSSTKELANGTEEQSGRISEIASATEEMSKTILDNTQHANEIAKAAEESGKKANNSKVIFDETFRGVERIDEVVSKAAETIQTLGKSSKEIGEIIQVINDIAEQTNLLALNAAIEAARAGEQGRGFAVVADEVRKLAEKTTKATKEIETMIKAIQVDTENAVVSIKEGSEEVKKDKELAKKAEVSVHEIIEHAAKVTEITGFLASASEEQSATSEQISKSIEDISGVTQKTAEETRKISNAAEGLYTLTGELAEVMNYFKFEYSASDSNNNKDEKGFSYYVGTNGKIH